MVLVYLKSMPADPDEHMGCREAVARLSAVGTAAKVEEDQRRA
jgi:hypothetical protein